MGDCIEPYVYIYTFCFSKVPPKLNKNKTCAIKVHILWKVLKKAPKLWFGFVQRLLKFKQKLYRFFVFTNIRRRWIFQRSKLASIHYSQLYYFFMWNSRMSFQMIIDASLNCSPPDIYIYRYIGKLQTADTQRWCILQLYNICIRTSYSRFKKTFRRGCMIDFPSFTNILQINVYSCVVMEAYLPVMHQYHFPSDAIQHIHS